MDCGGSRTISGSDNSMYQADNANLGAASYYVAGAPTWGVSSVGLFTNAPNGSYIIYSSRQFDNMLYPFFLFIFCPENLKTVEFTV